MVTSEKQQVAIELLETGPQGHKTLMGDLRIDKALASECLLLLLYMFALPFYSGFWQGSESLRGWGYPLLLI